MQKGIWLGVAWSLCYAQIGHRTITFNDPSRTGGFGSGGGSGRQIQTEIYYPAIGSGRNAPLRPGQYPIVVIGHGFLMEWSAYQNLWEVLVPAGYIVALPRTEGGLLPSHADFALDMQVVVQRLLQAGETSDSPFYTHIFPRAALIGHSMGGGCAVLAAQNFPDAHCVVGIAAANTNPSAIQAAGRVTLPALILAGSADSVTPPSQHQRPIYHALASSCKWLVTLQGGGHCYFANSSTTCEFGENSAGSPVTLTRAQQQALTHRILLPFLNAYLKDSCLGGFLDTLSATAGIATESVCAYERLTIQAVIVHPTVDLPTQGAITLFVRGGTPPYTYEWRHGAREASLTGLAAGEYAVRVSDAVGCSIDTTFVLTQTTGLSQKLPLPSRVHPNPFYEGIVVEISGSLAPLPWRLSDVSGRLWQEGFLNSQTTYLSFPHLPAGIYWLEVGKVSMPLVKLP